MAYWLFSGSRYFQSVDITLNFSSSECLKVRAHAAMAIANFDLSLIACTTHLTAAFKVQASMHSTNGNKSWRINNCYYIMRWLCNGACNIISVWMIWSPAAMVISICVLNRCEDYSCLLRLCFYYAFYLHSCLWLAIEIDCIMLVTLVTGGSAHGGLLHACCIWWKNKTFCWFYILMDLKYYGNDIHVPLYCTVLGIQIHSVFKEYCTCSLSYHLIWMKLIQT